SRHVLAPRWRLPWHEFGDGGRDASKNLLCIRHLELAELQSWGLDDNHCVADHSVLYCASVLFCGSRAYFFSRMDRLKVIPTSSPSGEMKRLTICPQGSFLFFTSIRYPACFGWPLSCFGRSGNARIDIPTHGRFPARGISDQG